MVHGKKKLWRCVFFQVHFQFKITLCWDFKKLIESYNTIEYIYKEKDIYHYIVLNSYTNSTHMDPVEFLATGGAAANDFALCNRGPSPGRKICLFSSSI